MRDGENKYLELYEEYNMLNDDMHELQQELEDAGFFDQAEEETEEKSRFAQLLGGAKMKGMFNKTRKVLKWGKSKTEEKEANQEEEAKNTDSATPDKAQEVVVLHQETKPASPKKPQAAADPLPSTDPIPDETPTDQKKDIKNILQDIKNDKTEKEDKTTAEKKKEKKNKDKDKQTKEENEKLQKQTEELNNKIKEFTR